MHPRKMNVDERKFIQFGVFHGFLYKLTTYPIINNDENTTEFICLLFYVVFFFFLLESLNFVMVKSLLKN